MLVRASVLEKESGWYTMSWIYNGSGMFQSAVQSYSIVLEVGKYKITRMGSSVHPDYQHHDLHHNRIAIHATIASSLVLDMNGLRAKEERLHVAEHQLGAAESSEEEDLLVLAEEDEKTMMNGQVM